MKLGFENYTFLNVAVEGFEHGQCPIHGFCNSVKILEWGTSFNEPDTMISSITLGLLFLVSTSVISPNCRFLLASNLVSYGARLGNYILPVSVVGKFSVSKCICYV